MNQTLRETLTNLAIETGGDWVTLLPFALFRARNTPYKLNLTPFEILYVRPPHVCPIFKGKCLPPPLCLGCCNAKNLIPLWRGCVLILGPGNAKTKERANQWDHHSNLVQSWAGRSRTLGQFQQTLMALSKVHNHVWKLIQEIHEGQNTGAHIILAQVIGFG